MAESDLELVEQLDRLIPLYLRALRTALAEAVGPDRLTMQQLRCLQAIDRTDDGVMTTTRLSDLMSVSVPTMSSMLDGLASRELVERRPMPGDRRRVLLTTTERGKATLAAYQAVINGRHQEIVRGLSEVDRTLLREASTMLLTRLESLLNPANTQAFGHDRSSETANPISAEAE